MDDDRIPERVAKLEEAVVGAQQRHDNHLEAHSRQNTEIWQAITEVRARLNWLLGGVAAIVFILTVTVPVLLAKLIGG